MIFKIAWRNIWRSKIRSFTVMGSIVVGVWALAFVLSFSAGFINTYINSAIENEISHIQIHHPKFLDEREVEYNLANSAAIIEQVEQQQAIEAYAIRSLNNGMLATSKGSRGVQIRGINPTQEQMVTKLGDKLIDGKYFGQTKKKNPIIISERLAAKLKLKVKSKVVLTFQGVDGELVSAAFKVIGLYKTGNAIFEEMNIFVQQTDLSRLLGDQGLVHEIALVMKDIKSIPTVQEKLTVALPDVLVENYKEVSPDVNMYESQMSISTSIVITIVMLALIFGIINTMLMAVLERTKELGMLMAIGMKPRQVFSMIIVETLLLGLLAAPVGLLFGFLTVSYYSNVGIDLSAYSGGMDMVGMSSMVYPTLEMQTFITIAVSVAVTALLGALYPARKATKLKPVEAMQKI